MHKDRGRLMLLQPVTPAAGDAFDDLLARQARLDRRRRSASLVVAVSIGALGVGVALFAFRPVSPENPAPVEPGRGFGPAAFVHTELDRYLPSAIGEGSVRCTDETWIRPDGAGRIARTYEEGCLPRLTSGAAHLDRAYGRGEMPGVEVRTLSSDPTVLAGQLPAAAPPSVAPPSPPGSSSTTSDPEAARLIALVAVLESRWAYPAPEVRSALVQILRAAGFEEIPDQLDPVGRAATLISFPMEGSRLARLYIDAESDQPLAIVVVDEAGIALRIDVIASTEYTTATTHESSTVGTVVPPSNRSMRLPYLLSLGKSHAPVNT
jgi:hypothetical protein